MIKYKDFITEMRNTRTTVQFHHDMPDGEVVMKTWPDPKDWHVIDYGVGGDRFGSEATVSYQNLNHGYVVTIYALDIGRGGTKGTYELNVNGVTKKGTFTKFEDIDGLLTKQIPAEANKIQSGIEKQIPKKIGNFTRSMLPFDLDVSYDGMNKDGNQTSIVFEDIASVVEGGTGTYYCQIEDNEMEGTWKSFKDMVSIVKKL